MAAAILGSWVGTLGWLTWRVYHRDGGAFSTGSITVLPPDAFFYSIEILGQQVGVGSITIDTLTDGVRITERLGYDLPIQRSNTRSQFTNQYTLSSNLRLQDFRITYPGNGIPIIQQGSLEGDTVLVVSLVGGEPNRRVRVGTAPLLPPIMATVALAQQQRLRTGERTRIAVFDPATLTSDLVDLNVVDDSTVMIPDSAEYDAAVREWKPVHSDTMRAFRISWQDSRRGFELWVDIRGLPIAVGTPSGLSMYRSAFEIVNANYRERRSVRPPAAPGNVIPRTAIASGVAPDAPVPRMTVQVLENGTPWAPGPYSLSPPGLNVRNDRIEMGMVDLDTMSEESPTDSASLWLSESPYITLGDSLVQEQVQAVTSRELRPDRIARRLADWVARNIERSAQPGLAPAGTVLRTRRADVDGHTLAYVTLARAAGIPARPVSGLLLVDGQFYFHSWAEIFLNRWIPVDPTWNQFPADAGRLRLLVNGYAQPLELLPMAAGLEIHLETARP